MTATTTMTKMMMMMMIIHTAAAAAATDVWAVHRTASESKSKRCYMSVYEGIRRQRAKQQMSAAMSRKSQSDLWRKEQCYLLTHIPRY